MEARFVGALLAHEGPHNKADAKGGRVHRLGESEYVSQLLGSAVKQAEVTDPHLITQEAWQACIRVHIS